MLPKVRDVREAVQTVGYNLGYRHSLAALCALQLHGKGGILGAGVGHDRHGHHRHPALGPHWVLAHLPYPMSVLDVTTAVHFYEAILATFSILIWHFYFVIFDPDVYPLKWTVLTGRAPEHEVREEEEEPVDQNPGNRRNLRKGTRAILPLRPPRPRANLGVIVPPHAGSGRQARELKQIEFVGAVREPPLRSRCAPARNMHALRPENSSPPLDPFARL